MAAVKTPRLRDERICWLSVRDELQRRARRRRMWQTVLTVGLAPRQVRAWEQRRMSRFALVVDRLAGRLTDAERQALRTGRQVPEWFLPAVLETSRQRGAP